MTNIYELNLDIDNLLNQYYENFDMETGEVIWTDEDIERVKKELDELQNRKDDLKKWVLQKIQNEKSDIAKINNEIKRLNDLKESLNKKVASWEKFAQYLFSDLDKNIIFENWKVWYSKSKRVIVEDEAVIPNEYKKYIPEQIIPEEYKTDKNLLKWFLKEKEIPWCELKEFKTFFIK